MLQMARGMVQMEIEEELLDIVAKEALVDRALLHPDATLESLSIQSADYVMVLMAIEEKWGVYIAVDEELADAKTVGDLVAMVKSRIEAKAAGTAGES
ncbi:MAG: phosphopantetheine-binding protein [Phyllobacteriaceae bacterium]|nr:phosphopantetheine-binding protein [Phyllobacteriaceae bacterium]MBA93058.1 phosphopantetheine-binding protein [Phyllobacteriaceae bacterium]